MNAQKVMARGNHKAVITRIAARKWAVARGYSDEIKLSYDVRTCPTQRMAIAYAVDWLRDASFPSNQNEGRS